VPIEVETAAVSPAVSNKEQPGPDAH
jgi:hypothetical protein